MAITTNDDLKSKAYSRQETDDTFVKKDVFIEELQEASQRALTDETNLKDEINRSIAKDEKLDNNFTDLWGEYDPDKDYDKKENTPSKDSLLNNLFENYKLPIPPEVVVFEDFHPDGIQTRFLLPEDLDYDCSVLAFKNGILLDALNDVDDVGDLNDPENIANVLEGHDYFLTKNTETGRVYIYFAEIPDVDDKIQVSYIKKAVEIPHRQIKTYQLTPTQNVKSYSMPADTDYNYTIKVFMNGVFLDDDTDYQINTAQKNIIFPAIELDEDDEILIHYLSTIDAKWV
jgi:hypothetical protein